MAATKKKATETKKEAVKEEANQNTTENTAEETVNAEAAEETKQEPDKTAELENAVAAEKEKYLRLYAEYENFRKRSQKEREALYTDVKANTILQLLPIYDNLARALAQECTDEAFYKGIEMTMKQLHDTFEKLGVKEIEAVGKTFDPALHNAVMHIDDETKGENEIVNEFEKGFMLGDKVIRFSVVQVAN